MRRTWLKPVAVGAGVAVLGAVAATVALKAAFPEPKLRALALEKARKQLGREVRLQRAGLGLTGLRLTGLEISESPDFAAGAFLKAEEIRLRPSWRALLKRRVVVASASADGLSARVVRGKDGAWNFATLAAAAPAPVEPKAPGASFPADFSIRHLGLTRASLEFRDDHAGRAWNIKDLALKADGLNPSDPFSLELALKASGSEAGRAISGALDFAGEVDPARGDLAAVKIRARRLTLESEGATLKAKGTLATPASPKADFDATLSYLGVELVTAAGSASISTSALTAELKAETRGFDLAPLAKFLPKGTLPLEKVPAFKAELSARKSAGDAAVKRLELSWDGGRVSGAGSVRGLGGAKPAFEGAASVAAKLPAVAPGQYPFLKLPPKLALPAGELNGEVSLAGDEARLKSLTWTGKPGRVAVAGAVRKLLSAKPAPDLSVALALDLPAVKAAELPPLAKTAPVGLVLPAARVEGEMKVKGDDLVLSPLTVKTAQGTIRVEGPVTGALSGAPRPEVTVAANLALPALTDKDLPITGLPAGLDLPPTKWDALVEYSPRLLRVRKLALFAGSNELAVEGSVSDPAGRAAFDLLLKCRRFVLAELTRLTPATRELKLSGDGFFALSVTGTKEKPVFGGKLQFKGVGATVGELPLTEFTGTASFDERRVDIPNLKGKLAEGALTMDLTVKDFAKSPEIQLEAELDRLDLGRWFKAKKKVQDDRAAARAAKGKPAPDLPAIRTLGKVEIGALTHPSAEVRTVIASWDLFGLTPKLDRLNGEAKLDVGGGRVRSVGDLATQSPAVKVLLVPLLIVQKIGRLGGIRLFPDFNDIAVRRVAGDYAFKDGVMTVRRSEMDSSAAQVSAVGTVTLPTEALDLTVTAQVANIAPMDVAVTGTITDPKSKVKLGKFLGDLLK